MKMFKLKPLPYDLDALAPVMSERTLRIHHGKHQAGYAEKLNELIAGTDYQRAELDAVMLSSFRKQHERSIFNNAAQLWNHEFYWQSLAPVAAAAEPPKALAARLVADFGTVSAFRARMVEVGANHFGSGWLWLVAAQSGALGIEATHDAENPLLRGAHPLFVCDLWEHAYYLDYQQDREQFLRAVVERLINWKQVETRLTRVQERRAA